MCVSSAYKVILVCGDKRSTTKGYTMRKVVIMSGPSGAGKTHHIEKVFPRIWYPALQSGDIGGAHVVSTNHYFMKNDIPLGNTIGYDYRFDASKLNEAHGECFKHFINALQDYTQDVVVDNTNTTESEISPYILGAAAYKYEVEVIRIAATASWELRECYARGKHSVPLGSIITQARRMTALPSRWRVSVISFVSLDTEP